MKMDPLKIVMEELKVAGLDVAEETVKAFIKTTFEKILPRLALESDNVTVKSICGVVALAGPVISKSLIEMADKIDGQVG